MYAIPKIIIKISYLALHTVCKLCNMQTDFQITVIIVESVKKNWMFVGVKLW